MEQGGWRMVNRGSRGDDLDLTLAALLVGLLLAGSLLPALSETIHEITRGLAWLHVQPFAFLNRISPGPDAVPILGQWLVIPAGHVEPALRPMTKGEGGLPAWTVSMEVAARCAAALYCVPCCVLMILSRRSRPDLQLRTRLNLEALIAASVPFWPAGGVVRHLTGTLAMSGTLASQDTDRGMPDVNEGGPGCVLGKLLVPLAAVNAPESSADALWPEHWLVRQGLVNAGTLPGQDDQCMSVGLFRELDQKWEPDSGWASLTHDTVGEAFAMQLTSPWLGIDSLKSYEKALVAALACCHDLQLTECWRILRELARIADRHFGMLGRFDRHLNSHATFMRRIHAILRSSAGIVMTGMADNHAWKATAMMHMYHCSRRYRGIVAPAEFLWLKQTDRQLWYALNAVGNAVSVAESAGIHAHYCAERQIGCPLYRPAVIQASRVLLDDNLDQSEASVARRRHRKRLHRLPAERIATSRAGTIPPFPGLSSKASSCGF